MTFGERALWYAVEHFHLPEFLAELWVTLRFPVAGRRQLSGTVPALRPGPGYHPAPEKHLARDALFSLAAWMAFSWLYSYYANHFSHYSVLYGSIGAVIVVLIWLNLTAVHADSGCGGERRAHQHAEGPSGAGRQRAQGMNRLSNLKPRPHCGKGSCFMDTKSCRNMQNY